MRAYLVLATFVALAGRLPAQGAVDTLAAVRVVAPRMVTPRVIASVTMDRFEGGAPVEGVRDAVLLGKEQIAIVDWRHPRVQLFSYTGEFKGRMGLKGDEPGQFALPYRMVSCGNGNITVLDIGNRLVNEFYQDGTLRYTVPLAAPPQSLACWPNGEAVGVFVRADSTGMLRANVRPLDTLDVPRAPLLSVPAGEVLLMGAALQLGASRYGVWHGTGDTNTITFRSWPTLIPREDSVGTSGRPTTQLLKRAAIEQLAREADIPTRARVQLMLDLQKVPTRTTLPAYRTVLVDSESHDAWVVTSPVGNRRLDITILSIDGQSRRTIRLNGFELLSVRGDEALVVGERLADGSAELVVYSVALPSPPR
ncbi:hypothetical protein [Gemmatimonas phototrophica]|uniref:6-bladed beta-propeller n=1 Tax=Gemmatimonas phototrophica TaxID=1379270 RepID=A0A143BGS9_9BACT|nr:hypothetical protein [Gemmatimonas phototrophica]AMW04248.1 hypothetical protein GEMMAAP_04130 [Gemmatimonas phototrophica]